MMVNLQRHTCVVCGRPIGDTDHYAFRGTCDHWKCRAVLFRQLREEQREAAGQQERRRGLLETARTAALQARGLDPTSDCPALALPANCRPLAPLPEERRQRFGEYLRTIIAMAFEDTGANDGSPPREEGWPAEPYQGEPAAVLAAACTTCAGYCCQHGGERAFLTAVTIRRFRAGHPDATPGEVHEAYMSRLGTTVYEHSCVYHGPQGCTLPRDMRSDPCNGFSCDALTAVQHACGQGHARLFLAAMEDEKRLVRWQLVGVPAG